MKKTDGHECMCCFKGLLSHSSVGAVGFANFGAAHTNNSQFYITLAPQPHLDGRQIICGAFPDLRVVGVQFSCLTFVPALRPL